ncbi:transcriptional regulator [Clostridium autoethanogenum]|uniref:Transcriptional regulator n=1 Tax=Clostridium autoethanogenum TaxID=84023 RepID=A0A3M0RZP8_9CLOT|nr:transcriptional regulator [Clostridium autoethanogenum]
MLGATEELLYDGAKPMLLVDDVDNKKFLYQLIIEMYKELPAPKVKKRK